MATSRHVSYCRLQQDKTTQCESSSKAEFDDGSKTLTELETVFDKVTMMERWLSREGDALNRYIKSYQAMRERFEEDLGQCKLVLLNLLEKQEEKTREMKKLNLLIFETGDDGLRRTDEQSKKRAESLCLLATNTYIAVQWATQLDQSLPGMLVTRVRFYTEEDKKMVLSGEGNLLRMGIYLDHDLTKSELEMQRNVNEMVEEARVRGRVSFSAKNTVCIDGTYHTFV